MQPEPFTIHIDARGEIPEDDVERIGTIAQAFAYAIASLAEHSDIPPCQLSCEVIGEIIDMMVECGHGGCAARVTDAQAIKLAALGRKNGIPLND